MVLGVGQIFLSEVDKDEVGRVVWAVIGGLPQAVTILTVPDYRIILINGSQAAALRNVGVEPPENVLGKHPWDISSEWKEWFLPYCEQARRSGEVQEVHGLSCQYEGEAATYDFVVVPYALNATGEVGYLAVISTDVTEHEKAEEALRGSQEVLRLVMDNIPQSIFWKDTDSVFLGCNRLFAEQAGLDDPKDIVGKTDYDFPWSREESDAYRRDDKRVMESDTPVYHIIEPQSRTDGTLAWLDTSKIPLHDSDGNVVGILGTYEDITERIRTEQDLLRYRSALDAATEGIALTDPYGRMFYGNPAFGRMFGYTVEELQELGIGVLHADQGLLYNEITSAIVSGHPWTGEVPMRRKDGTPLMVDIRAAPVMDSEGVLVALMAIFTDITERRRVEELDAAFNAMNAVIGSTLDADEILSRLVVESVRAIGCESAVIFLREPGRWRPKYVYGASADVLERVYNDEDVPYAAYAGATRQPVVINDVYGGQIVPSQAMIDAGVRSLLLLPLVTRGESVGVLIFVYRSSPVGFSDAVVDFARRLGTSISLALENARLYDAARAAATREAEARDIAERQLSILQRALVPGKGIDAAARAAASRSTVRAFAYELGAPGPALTHANSVLCSQLVAPEGMPESFVTLFLAILNPQRGTLRYSIAGHPPPVIYHASGSSELLGYGQLPIGLHEGTTYQDSETTLEPGDRLIMYTDGLSEARRRGEMFDIEGIEREVYRCGRLSAQGIVDHLISAMGEWTSNRVTDDTAILVVGRVGSETSE